MTTTYNWTIAARTTDPARRKAARLAYVEARARYREQPVEGGFPSHTLEEQVWNATVADHAAKLVWTAGGSSERIAVQRAAAAMLADPERRR